MLRDVDITVADGQLAKSTGEGVHVKLGVSPVAYTEPLVIRNDMDARRIQDRLGLSPLADACMDSVENGASLIYCIPVAASVQGTVGTVKKTPAVSDPDEASTGTMTIAGSPNNRYRIAVKITKGGALNEAALKYSFDNGVSWSDEVTMPVGGSLAVSPTGLTFTFTEGVGPTKFMVGDSFAAETTAPGMTNESVLAALAHVRDIKKPVEFVHIVGESSGALWAALASEATKFFSAYYKPVFFLLETRAADTEETAREYIDALVAERKSASSYLLQVVAANGVYRRMDGTTQSINLAGIVAGLYARSGIAQSISETANFSISADKLLRLEPAGVEDDLDLLDEAGFLTFRSYEGLDGWYVTKPNMIFPEGSDYRYAEHVRVLCKAARLVRAEALLQLHRSINLEKQDQELEAMAKFIAAPLETMADAGEISAGEVTIPPGQDILQEEHLRLILRFVPRGYVRWISIELGMKNPKKEV